MKRFKEYLNESMLSSKSLSKAKGLIQSYLAKKYDSSIFCSAGLEQWSSKHGKGYGLRFYSSKSLRSIRFNWATSTGDNNFLKSIDIWMGKAAAADFHIGFEQDVSLVQVLPLTASILSGKEKVKPGRFMTTPKGTDINESAEIASEYLVETYDSSEIFDYAVSTLVDGGTRMDVWKKYKSAGNKITDQILATHKDKFEKNGRKWAFVGGAEGEIAIRKNKDAILSEVGAVKAKISKGSSETYETSQEVKQVEADPDRVVYREQIEHLKELARLVIGGAANALFVAGRGGIGKTYNVEDVVMKSELGWTDGNQYFKNTGSATPAGLYRLFAERNDSVLFFDDSDSALDSQEARNLFKAATDTKKVRKLVWSKAGSNVVDPEEYGGDIAAIIKEGNIPKYFNFTGKVIFISNLKPEKLDPDGALRTRAFMINVDPTEKEVYELLRDLVNVFEIADGLTLGKEDRLKVVDIFEKATNPRQMDFRRFQRGLNLAAGAVADGRSVEAVSKVIALYA